MRETILHRATEMFLTMGFKSVTMDDIATEMGISKKTIYAHFDNKNKLISASATYLFEIISAGIDDIASQKLNVIEEIFVIKDFVNQHLKNEQSSPHFQLQKYYPKIADALRERQLGVMKTCVVENLERGIETGIYRPEIDPRLIAKFYIMGMMGIKDHELFPPQDMPLPQLTTHYIEYHIRAISTQKGLDVLSNFINQKQQ